MHDQPSNIYIHLRLSYSWSFSLLGIRTLLVTPREKSAPKPNTVACLQAASGIFPRQKVRAVLFGKWPLKLKVFSTKSDWNSLNYVMTEG